MVTNTTQKVLRPCAWGKRRLSIGRVKLVPYIMRGEIYGKKLEHSVELLALLGKG